MRTPLSYIGMLVLVVLLCAGCRSVRPGSAVQPRREPLAPPEEWSDVKTLVLLLETEPAGAEVYAASRGGNRTRLGTSPIEVKLSFCEYDGVVWLKNPPGWDEATWFTWGSNVRAYYVFYLGGPDFYGMRIETLVYGTPDGKYLSTTNGSQLLTDGYRIAPIGFPVRLVTHGRVFAQEFVRTMNTEDYYAAEEMRLRRIDQLRSALQESNDLRRLFDPEKTDSKAGRAYVYDTHHCMLMQSEIEQLQHTVGLLDPQLMAMRKQLLTKLQAGDIETALVLAQAVSAMERRYFPQPEERPTVTDGQATTTVVQGQQGPARQEIVVQQKPYYGATNIVEALGAMRGSKVDPEAYQKALGGAQLMDVLGFGGMINK